MGDYTGFFIACGGMLLWGVFMVYLELRKGDSRKD